ncbi:kinase-like protein [Marasmius fiardii PR-910]|nr:kinase-like protein [Marasmius fiardii PR-910]
MRKLMRDRNQLQWVLKLRDHKADRVLEDMQRASYSPECDPSLKSSLLNAMIHLCEASGRSVRCQYNASVRKIGYSPFSSQGTFTDVWKGTGVDGNAEVALKVVKSGYIPQVVQKIEIRTREILKWRTLDHLNVIPFMGNFCFGKNPMEICFVSPWMENGSLVGYLQKNQTDLEKRFSFAWDVASGLEYLHSLDIVHGNLKGHNVLITSEEVACITDYGLVNILDGSNIRPTPWCAREVLTEGSITQKSDMYAYGTVCCEIFAERVPFHNLNENELYEAIVVRNQLPERPAIDGPMPWGVVERCWSADPDVRPAASEVVRSLEELGWLFSDNTSNDASNDPDDPFS